MSLEPRHHEKDVPTEIYGEAGARVANMWLGTLKDDPKRWFLKGSTEEKLLARCVPLVNPASGLG